MKNRKALLAIIGVVVIAVVAVGVWLTQKRVWQHEEKDVKIGVVLELTGPLSRLGERSLKGMEMAVQEINAHGGVNNRTLKLIVEDDKSDPKEAVTAFQKLISQYSLRVIIGLTGSSIVMACAPIANERKVVLLSVGATSPLITNAGDYIFRNRLSGEAETKAMADFAVRILGIRKIAILYVNTDYGIGNKRSFEEEYKALGGEVLFSEGFAQGEANFKSILTKVKKVPIDGIYLLAVSESGHALKQAKELGISVRFLSTAGVEGPDVLKVAGDAANGVIYTVQKFDPGSSEKSRLFREKYLQKYHEEPDLFAALGYDGINILAKVINDYGYDAEAIKNGLYGLTDFPGVTGLITFDKNGDIQAEVMVKIIQDGNFIPYIPYRRGK